SAVLTEDFEEARRMISLSRGAPAKKLRLTEQPAAVRFDLDLEADPADGDATRIVHPSLQGVRSPDCGGRADRGRGRGDCRRARRGVLRTLPHPAPPGSLVALRGRSGGLTGRSTRSTRT